MIRLIIAIVVFGLAMLLGPVLTNNPGYLMLVFAGVTVEATVVGLLAGLLLLLVAGWLLWWLITRLFRLPKISFGFLRSRTERRARKAFEQALLAYARQDWRSANTLFDNAKAAPEWQKIKLTMAAYSAWFAGDGSKAIKKAAELEQDDPDTWYVVADLLLLQQQAAAAVTYLEPKMAKAGKDQPLAPLWFKALRLAGQWQLLLEQVPLALKQQWFSKLQWQAQRYQIYPYAVSGLAQSGQFDENAAYWLDLPGKERKSVAAALGKVWALALAGQAEAAEKLLLDHLALNDLAVAWPALQQIPLGRSVLQLRKQAQHWLRDHSNNGYLYALLSYCDAQEGEVTQAQLTWQKALQYQPGLTTL